MSRKYKQRGYQEDDRDERAPRRTPPRERQPEERYHRKGLRHALDRDANAVLRCYACGRNVQDVASIAEASSCPHCSAALHCCRNCRQFDSGARWQCRAEIAEPVADKTKANACTEYAPALVLDATGKRTRTASGRAGDPRSAFEDLFKK